MKKIISVLLTMLIALCVCTINIVAEGNEKVDELVENAGMDSTEGMSFDENDTLDEDIVSDEIMVPIEEMMSEEDMASEENCLFGDNPTSKTGLVYNGSEQVLINPGNVLGYEYRYRVNGSGWKYKASEIKGKDAGTYVVEWQRKLIMALSWPKKVNKLEVEIASVETEVEIPTNIELTYNGKEQTGIKENEHYEVVGGDNTATNVGGPFTVTLQLKDENYKWSDGTKDNKTVQWEIVKRKITLTANYDMDYTQDWPDIKEMSKHIFASHGALVEGHVVEATFTRPVEKEVGEYVLSLDSAMIKDSNGTVVTGNYDISFEEGKFKITLIKQPNIKVDNAIGYVNEDGNAMFFIKNFEDFKDDVKFEIATERDPSKREYKEIECHKYSVGDESYYYVTIYNKYGSGTYHIRAKGDDTHEPSNSIALEVRKSSIDIGLSDVKINQGHADGKAVFGLSLAYSLRLGASNEEEQPRDYVLVTVDDQVLTEGEDFNVDIDIHLNWDLSLNVFTITLTDDFANTLGAGKHDVGFNIVSHSSEAVGESYVPHATLNVVTASTGVETETSSSSSSLPVTKGTISKASIIRIVSTGVE